MLVILTDLTASSFADEFPLPEEKVDFRRDDGVRQPKFGRMAY